MPTPPPSSKDFELSRAGWELYHRPRMQRANWPVVQPKLMTREEFAAEAAEPSSTLKQGESKMRGMNRLANLAQTIMDEIDKEADSVADELVAAKQEAKQTIGHFREHAGQIRKVANDVKAQLGQISNIPPTEGSGS